MQANWSLILNILLLVGVIAVISRLMKARKKSFNYESYQPSLGQTDDSSVAHDDIIAVRKIDFDILTEGEPEITISPRQESVKSQVQPILMSEEVRETRSAAVPKSTLMMFLLAKENRQFAGYELLQSVLAAGLRFGEGQLFHRHQNASGQGPLLFSLAAATSTGVFDLQNIGAFTVRGLCLYMQTSDSPAIDSERFAIMLDTAKQLKEGLDAHLLDGDKKPLNEERLARYYRMLQIEEQCA